MGHQLRRWNRAKVPSCSSNFLKFARRSFVGTSGRGSESSMCAGPLAESKLDKAILKEAGN